MAASELKRRRSQSWEGTGDTAWNIYSSVDQPALAETSIDLPQSICYGAVCLMNFSYIIS